MTTNQVVFLSTLVVSAQFGVRWGLPTILCRTGLSKISRSRVGFQPTNLCCGLGNKKIIIYPILQRSQKP